MENLYWGTTRRSAKEPASVGSMNKDFALPLASAMAGATAGTEYSCFADAWTGSLKAGMKAYFAVVDMEWDAEKLLEAKVCETWFEGRKVWDARGP